MVVATRGPPQPWLSSSNLSAAQHNPDRHRCSANTCTKVSGFGVPVSKYSFNIYPPGLSKSLDHLLGYLGTVSSKSHGSASSLGWMAPAATSEGPHSFCPPQSSINEACSWPLIKGYVEFRQKHMVFAQNLTVFIYVLNNLFFLLLQNSTCLFGKTRQAKIKYKSFINPSV